jgi:hypothetical protein
VIPEEEWTNNQREFVGSEFDTPKGGVLTVTGVVGKTKRGMALFSVECSICSKDDNRVFTAAKNNLKVGKCPCNCSSNRPISDEDDIAIVNDYFIDSGRTLVAKEAIRRKNSSHRYFILECSVCSKDTELFPYGSLISSKGDLIRGRLPCGCSRIPKWTEDQNKIRIQRECDKRGYVFHGWCGEYIGKETKLSLENPVTDNIWNTTEFNSFMYGKGDPAASGSGFDSSKPSCIYINKFSLGGQPKTLKFGITNHRVKFRLQSQSGYSGFKGETIFTYSNDDGKVIADLERKMMSIIKLDRVPKDLMPDGHTESVHYKPFVEHFIVNYLEMLTKNLR